MSSSFVGSSVSTGTPGVGIATSILKLGLSELSQHTARVSGATNENQAADQIIPAFDADLAACADAYNSGQYSATEIITALQAIDAQVYKYLKAQVGKPGTAWDGSGKCGKTCTVGCCLYYNDLHSAIFGPAGPPYNGNLYASNGANGFIPTLQKGSGAVIVPKVYPPSDTTYGDYSRAGYTIVLTQPAAKTNIATSVSGTVNKLIGAPGTAPPPQTTSQVSSGILSTLTNTEIVAILGVLGGIILIITALFGQNALRVNR